MKDVAQKTVGRNLSQRWVVVQVADDLAAQQPQVIHVLADGLRGETRLTEASAFLQLNETASQNIREDRWVRDRALADQRNASIDGR
jgi:hypothetical protein